MSHMDHKMSKDRTPCKLVGRKIITYIMQLMCGGISSFSFHLINGESKAETDLQC